MRDPRQIPLTSEDYKRIPDIYSSYDRIEKGTPDNQTGAPSVRYLKKYPDGTLYAVDVVATSGECHYKTGWKKP